jgi:hypothetical protein
MSIPPTILMEEGDDYPDEKSVSYSIRLTRNNHDGTTTVVEFTDYGLLHELMEHILDRTDGEGWLKEWPI